MKILTKTIAVRTTEQEYQDLQQAAQRSAQPLAQWARFVLLTRVRVPELLDCHECGLPLVDGRCPYCLTASVRKLGRDEPLAELRDTTEGRR